MRREIAAVVFFLKRLVKKGEKLESHKIELFVERLAVALQEKFKGHWYPENPSKGQAYRCCLSSHIYFYFDTDSRNVWMLCKTENSHLLVLYDINSVEIIERQLRQIVNVLDIFINLICFLEVYANNTFQKLG